MTPARLLPWIAAKRLAVVLAALAIAAAPALAQSGQLAREVKATFLVKFGAYVGWPAAVLADGAPLTICTVGADPMGDLVDAAAQGQSVGGHAVQVRHLAAISRDSGCQIAFLGDGAGADAISGAPVLTVTDGASPARRGMVDFTVAGGRVRFSIDQAAAMAAGLTISSKLLQIAVSVRERGQ
jgi:hypothetical protein